MKFLKENNPFTASPSKSKLTPGKTQRPKSMRCQQLMALERSGLTLPAL